MKPWQRLTAVLILCGLCGWASQARAENRDALRYTEKGEQALRQRDYRQALSYYQTAHEADPEAQKPVHYIRLIQSLLEAEEVSSARTKTLYQKAPVPHSISQKRKPGDPPKPGLKSGGKDPASVLHRSNLDRASDEPETNDRNISSRPRDIIIGNQEYFVLDDLLWKDQPHMSLEIPLRTSLILTGDHLRRFLVLDPRFLDVERIDQNRLKLTAKIRGATFLHVWDRDKRWTFYVRITLPAASRDARKQAEERIQKSVKPFHVTTSSVWGQALEGDSFRKLEEGEWSVTHLLNLTGEIPYGDVDASMLLRDEETRSSEVLTETVGLTDGRYGPFKDFSIRGYDFSADLSDFTLPPRIIRGIRFDARAFDDRLDYMYLRGRDKANAGTFVSNSGLKNADSYVEGGQVTLFPEGDHQYTLNVIRGFGKDRSDTLQDQVLSAETTHNWDHSYLDAELAYNQTAFAYALSTGKSGEDYSLNLSFDDISRDYSNIFTTPGASGRIVGNLGFNWTPGSLTSQTNVNIYRDRVQFNPDHREALNYTATQYLQIPIDKTSRIYTTLSGIYTPQLISQAKTLSLNTTYTKNFRILGARPLTFSAGNQAHWSRYKNSPDSEFDRYGLHAGLSLSLMRDLNLYTRFNYYWTKHLESGEKSRPYVFTTGANYYRKLSDKLNANTSFYYRDEQNTAGDYSVLAGEDSLNATLALTFQPTDDISVFANTRMRNVWAENAERDAYSELDIRLGLQTDWVIPLHWNPTGIVDGAVFKDENANGRLDPEEKGFPGVIVKIGREQVLTDEAGLYEKKISAKSLTVRLDKDSVPGGYIFSTPVEKQIVITPGVINTINFGLSARSGIYGIVYEDLNGNGKPDSADRLFPKVLIRLDKDEKIMTDRSGAYVFDNIPQGPHRVTIDINSLPEGYLPLIKVSTDVELKEGKTFTLHIPLKKDRMQ